jgi:hypothetical protein
MLSALVELVGKRATQPPDAWRQGFHGDAVSPQLDRAEQDRLVGAAQLHWPGRADRLKRGPDRLRVPTEVADLVEETVAARPRQLNDIARRGDRYPVEAFGHGLESRTGCTISTPSSTTCRSEACRSTTGRYGREERSLGRLPRASSNACA